MPLLIALAEIPCPDGVMMPASAAVMVGAGVQPVLIYPSVAAALHRRGQPAAVAPDPAETIRIGGLASTGQ